MAAHTLIPYGKKKEKAQHFLDRREQAEAEMNNSWLTRDSKKCWKAALLMGNTAPRRRLRRFDQVTTAGAAEQEWTKQMLKPGDQGGCGGQLINFDEEVGKMTAEEAVQSNPSYRKRVQPDDLEAAQALLIRMQRDAPALRTGKSIVAHSLPNELVRIILAPWWTHKTVLKPGVGAPTKFPSHVASTIG